MRGTADEQVTRMFGIRDSRKAPHFVMMGGRAVVDYVHRWSFADVVPLLRRLPSLASLDDGFWAYLSGLRIRGSVKALPDGTRFDGPITPSEELLQQEGEGAFNLPLINVTNVAATVALISPALTAIVDGQIAYAALLFNHGLKREAPTFWFAEREGHPLWGRLAAQVEAVLGPEELMHHRRRLVYVAWDPAKPLPETHRSASGEWRHNYDPRAPLAPGCFAPRTLADALGRRRSAC